MRIYGPQITGSLGINGSSIGNFNNLVSTSSFNQYTSSVNTGSLATTGSNTFVGNQTLSGSIVPAVTNTYDLGDPTHQFRHLYLSSGSLYINGTKVLGATSQELQITTDAGQSLKILEAGSDTITLQSADGNITFATSGGGDVILDPNTGIIALKGTTTLYSGYKMISSDGNAIQIGNDLGITGSIVTTGNVNGINLSTFSSSIATTFSGIQSNTSSLTTRLNNIETFSASNANTSLNAATSSYAKTNSTNVFTGNQTITGSLYVTQDLVVGGSSSIQNISSSNLVIGAAYVTVNANSPSSRYAGLLIIDSGSTGGSGSFLYDAIDDEMVFVHKGNGTNITSSQVLMGPETYDNLGNEIYLTKNKLPKGFGNEHLVDSNISDDGTTISLGSNTTVTGSITATSFTGSIAATNGVVSGSSQVLGILSSLNTYTGSNDTTNTAQNSRLTTIESVTGSYETKGRGIVSGSSQITFSAISSLPTLVSGSSQIDLTATTNYGTYINQAVKTTSDVTFNNVSASGDLLAGGANKARFKSDGTHTYVDAIPSNSTIVFRANGATEYARLSSLGFGIGITPQGATNSKTLEIGSRGIIYDNNDNFLYGNNGWVDSGTWKYKQTGAACIMATNGGAFTFSTAASGTQNSSITWSDKFTIANSGAVTATGVITTGTTTGSDTGLGVSYGSDSSGYGRIRFYENGTNRNTIHSFSSAWGTGFTGNSRGAINIEGYYGVTIGPWNNPDFYITENQGNAYIKGTLTVNSTITENSSIRYKENVETIKYGLDKVLQMRGVTYDKKNTGVKEVGVIAEEIYDVLPELVLKNEEGEIDSVAYGRIVGVLIEAIKEQQKQIEELKSLIK